ncbi:hypothetical protein GQX73_g10795 [Xylaria multiplex]|uniref:Uncharacterized protein n=1 Tax=Xylaria multiplex TaxID=323545 RepID=A0A7C8ISD0_9PEZI|nr:hypothetical protein GQX73_g10795 [Xylaria multiplex]
MDRLVHALVALAIPGPGPIPRGSFPGSFPGSFQEPMGEPIILPGSITTTATTGTYDKFVPALTIPTPPATATAAIEPDKRTVENNDKHRPNSNECTPGDRACLWSLDEILFCNDDHQWVSYSSCQAGTFCHRLHMVCVPIVTDPPPKSVHKETRTQSLGNGPRGDASQCKEGDRRCNADFNRVDRCNSGSDWVTYHDCRKAEFCDDRIFECLPYTLPDPTSAIPGIDCVSNGTAPKTV